MVGRKLLTTKEAAETCRTSPWVMYDYVARGVFPAGVFVRLGRSIRWSAEELDSFFKRGGQGFPESKCRASKMGAH